MSHPWSSDFTPPQVLDTDIVHLEPLSPVHTELDFAALMVSREHLPRTLHWGDWPCPDFTVEENRGDLQRHWDEFNRREAYAYTVLTPDKEKCIGCIYMRPWDYSGEEQSRMSLRYWVIEEELPADLDIHLLDSVLSWVDHAWSFESVIVPTHQENQRGIRIATELGLTFPDQAGQANHVGLVWHREH